MLAEELIPLLDKIQQYFAGSERSQEQDDATVKQLLGLVRQLDNERYVDEHRFSDQTWKARCKSAEEYAVEQRKRADSIMLASLAEQARLNDLLSDAHARYERFNKYLHDAEIRAEAAEARMKELEAKRDTHE